MLWDRLGYKGWRRTNSLDDNGPKNALALLAVIEDLINFTGFYSIYHVLVQHKEEVYPKRYILKGWQPRFILTRIDPN